MDKSAPFGAVVELQPSCSFIVTKVGWGPKPDYKIKVGHANYQSHYLTHTKINNNLHLLLPRVRVLQILVEIVQPVKKIGKPPSKERQHITVAKLAEETQEETAHALKKLVIVTAQDSEGLFGDSAKELLRVDLRTRTVKREFGCDWRKRLTRLMDGKGRRIEVCQPADLVPGVVAILVLEVAGKVLKDEPVHSPLFLVLCQGRSRVEWGPTGLMQTSTYVRWMSKPRERNFVHVKSDMMCGLVLVLTGCHASGSISAPTFPPQCPSPSPA